MKHLVFILAILCLNLAMYSQGLSIGDKIPLTDIMATQNGKQTRISLQSKHTILTFAGLSCPSCITHLIKWQEMEKTLGEKVQLIAVSKVDYQKLAAQYGRVKKLKLAMIPVAASDTLLSSLFPYKSTPHDVWITPEGEVSAITFGDFMTEQNIGNWLKNALLNVRFKDDFTEFDPKQSFSPGKDWEQRTDLLFTSTLTQGIEGLSFRNTQTHSADKSITRFSLINGSALWLFKLGLYGDFINRIKVESADSILLKSNNAPLYCYEVYYPTKTVRSVVRKRMLTDLEYALSLSSKVEKRMVDCYALVISDSFLLKTIAINQQVPNLNAPDSIHFNNKPIARFVRMLNNNSPLLILDETNRNDSISISLPKEYYENIPALSNHLSKYGLSILPVKRDVELFIIYDSPNNALVR